MQPFWRMILAMGQLLLCTNRRLPFAVLNRANIVIATLGRNKFHVSQVQHIWVYIYAKSDTSSYAFSLYCPSPSFRFVGAWITRHSIHHTVGFIPYNYVYVWHATKYFRTLSKLLLLHMKLYKIFSDLLLLDVIFSWRYTNRYCPHHHENAHYGFYFYGAASFKKMF